MHHVLVVGAGKIGSLIAFLLIQSKQYSVFLADKQKNNPHIQGLEKFSNFKYVNFDAGNEAEVDEFLQNNKVSAVISSLPFFCNIGIAKAAQKFNLHYFDLTEDVETTQAVEEIAKNAQGSFVPQCGLAPGFISIIANHLMRGFPEIHTVKMRVGALPMNSSNALHYSLTWSTDGLINEYGNLCNGIINGESLTLLPLEGLEQVEIDGLVYEAFNTSGGIGSLADTYSGKVKNLSYKTLRYPGHCSKIKFLMNDLKLNEDRETLRRIFENAIPKTLQDVVLVYVSVTGKKDGTLIEENYVKKFYSEEIGGRLWSAIQLTTASGICAALDLVLENPQKYKGFVKQEQISFDDLTQNYFGSYYAK